MGEVRLNNPDSIEGNYETLVKALSVKKKIRNDVVRQAASNLNDKDKQRMTMALVCVNKFEGTAQQCLDGVLGRRPDGRKPTSNPVRFFMKIQEGWWNHQDDRPQGNEYGGEIGIKVLPMIRHNIDYSATITAFYQYFDRSGAGALMSGGIKLGLDLDWINSVTTSLGNASVLIPKVSVAVAPYVYEAGTGTRAFGIILEGGMGIIRYQGEYGDCSFDMGVPWNRFFSQDIESAWIAPLQTSLGCAF
jgi:hypothetical protein